MPEAGGPTTQSGIYFQNAVTALYLGEMLDPALPEDRRIHAVRAEAVAHVDDTVVAYARGNRLFIQAKERLSTDTVRARLWNDFRSQIREPSFTPADRLMLVLGDYTDEGTYLRDMSKRAAGVADAPSWLARLNEAQRTIVGDIEAFLDAPATTQDVFEIFSRLTVEKMTADEIESTLIYRRFPATSKDARELFRLLHHRIGGTARYRIEFASRDALIDSIRAEAGGNFTVADAPNIAKLRSAIYGASATLRDQRRTFGIGGTHVDRDVVRDLCTRATATGGQRTFLLVADGGRGKTVVMADLLDVLEAAGVQVLAIKADLQLTGVRSGIDIQERLALPYTLDRTVEELAREAPVVVLIDQIDALSQNLAHDDRTLASVLDTIARLAQIPNTRIVVSCRAFDRATDQRLRQLRIDQEVPLRELTEADVTQVLSSHGIDVATLSRATSELLRIPLHLDVFMRLVRNAGASMTTTATTLQALYTDLLTAIVLRPLGGSGPTAGEREAVLRAIVDDMSTHQRAAVPLETIRALGRAAEHAVQWLASEGIVVVNADRATPFHQTFFDFLFARRFVGTGTSLVTFLLGSPQALRQRTELVQVLLYARGAAAEEYRSWRDELWDTPILRPHLRRLLRRLVGRLPDPSAEEIAFAATQLASPDRAVAFLEACLGNPAWIGVIGSELAIALADERTRADVTAYAASIANEAPAEVAALMKPLLAQPTAQNSVWTVVAHLRDWDNPAMAELLAEAIAASGQAGHFFHFREVARHHPDVFLRIARTLLDACARDAANASGPGFNYLSGIFDRFVQTDFAEALMAVAQRHPTAFLDALLPWFIDVVNASANPPNGTNAFRYDAFAFTWRSSLDRMQTVIVNAVIAALRVEAADPPASFDTHIAQLSTSDLTTLQSVVATVYTALPVRADDAVAFLVGDTRRLDLGSSDDISVEVIRSAATAVSDVAVAQLEQAILTYAPTWKPKKVEDLPWADLPQYRLLCAMPEHRLSAAGRKRLQELQRKHPDAAVVAAPPPVVMVRGESSPIAEDEARRMSDDDWLRALAKYAERTHPLANSPRQLAEILQRLASADRPRFSALLDRVPDDIADEYVIALINGLGDGPGPIESAARRAIERFANRASRDYRVAVSWLLQKHPADVDAGVRAILARWIADPSVESEHERTSSDHLNHVRGAAFLALMYALRALPRSDAAVERWRIFDTLDTASPALCSAAIEELRYELAGDADRAIAFFDRITHDDAVWDAHYFDDFLRLALGRASALAYALIERMAATHDEKRRARAARLIAIAAVSPEAVDRVTLLRSRRRVAGLLRSRTPPRLYTVLRWVSRWLIVRGRGAFVARLLSTRIRGGDDERAAIGAVLANNVDDTAGAWCLEELVLLCNDTSEVVRRTIGTAVNGAHKTDLVREEPLLRKIASSSAIAENVHAVAQCIDEHGRGNPALALDLIEMALPRMSAPQDAYLADDLTRFILRIAASTIVGSALQEHAMELLDAVDVRFGSFVQRHLSEWDGT